MRMATKHRSLALTAQLHRRQTSPLKCSRMLTHGFVLQISSRAKSLLQAHRSRKINLASFVRSQQRSLAHKGLTLTKLLACPLMFRLFPPPAALTACSTTPRDRSLRDSHKLSKMAAHHNTNWCLVSHRLPRVLPLSCIWELKTTSPCL